MKSAILDASNARLYNVPATLRAEVQGDKLAEYKVLYEKHGASRSNLAYGYGRKRG